MHIRLSSPGLTGRPSIPETAAIESISRGVLDAPPVPVIGLVKGETRGGHDGFARRDNPAAAGIRGRNHEPND